MLQNTVQLTVQCVVSYLQTVFSGTSTYREYVIVKANKTDHWNTAWRSRPGRHWRNRQCSHVNWWQA